MTRTGTVAVFLNYRTADATLRAVGSLRMSRTPIAHIIVVDNASDDGSPARIAAGVTGVQFIEADRNNGFSAGCNIGIRKALQLGADRVLLLNSDIVIPPEAVGMLEHAFDVDPRLGIVGPVLVTADEPRRVESAGMSYSRRTGRMRHPAHGVAISGLLPFTRRDVDAVSGCAMLIKREVFERVGLLAEEYFFGFEDLDFCLRARQAGFGVACVGGATIEHEGQRSIGRTSARRIYFATRNHLLTASRVPPTQSLPGRLFRHLSVLGFNLAHVLLTSEVPRGKGLGGFAMGVRDYLAGRFGPGPFEDAGERRIRSGSDKDC